MRQIVAAIAISTLISDYIESKEAMFSQNHSILNTYSEESKMNHGIQLGNINADVQDEYSQMAGFAQEFHQG